MKHLSFIALIVAMLFALPCVAKAEGAAMEHAYAARQQQKMLRGSVVDESGNYISYVTVVAMQDGRQVSGASSNTQGVFSFTLADGTVIKIAKGSDSTEEPNPDDIIEFTDFNVRLALIELGVDTNKDGEISYVEAKVNKPDLGLVKTFSLLPNV